MPARSITCKIPSLPLSDKKGPWCFKNLSFHLYEILRSEEDIFPDEEDGQDIHQGTDLFPVSREGVHNSISDDAKRDAFGDAVCEGHGKDGDICGNGFGWVAEVDARDGGEHEEAHDDEGGRGGKGGNCQEEGGKEQGEGKENGYGDGGKTGPSAFRNACRTFYEGGRGGNA